MKFFALSAVLLFALAAKGQDTQEIQPSMPHPASSEACTLSIEVETNVNKIDCSFEKASVFNHLYFKGSITDNSIDFKEASLHLPIEDFDCGGTIINRDFADLLNYREHPAIRVQFERVQWYDEATREQNIKRGHSIGYFLVKLTVGGHTEEKRLRVFSSHLSDNVLFSRGSVDLNMTEFGIEPPQKFLGMVKVKETLTIRFNLKMEVVP